MYKSSLLITALAMSLMSVFISCNSLSQKEEKVEDAKKDLAESQKNLDEATKSYLADVEKYKVEMAAKVDANNQSIADFKARIAQEKQEVKAQYESKVLELEQKNRDMKKAIDDYQVEGKEKWESFKTEFSRDMDTLGDAFKDLTVNNVK